jgi:hypothetical protein
MKVAQILIPLVLVTFLVTANRAQSACSKEKVCLSVVSQRLMTQEELSTLSPGLRKSLVRLRLSNSSRNEIQFLTWQDSVTPVGYRLLKKVSASEFGPLSKTERSPQNLKLSLGANFRYLRLPPNGAVEFDLPDWGNPTKDEEFPEHAFSIFVKAGGGQGNDGIVELVSETFKPLRE